MKSNFITKDIILFFVISILFFISITAFDPFISTYAKELGIAPSMIGSIIGAAGIASLFLRFPVGVISDFMSRRKLMIQFGLILTIIAWAVAFMYPSKTTLYIAKFVDGTTGSTWVIYNVMFASYFGLKEAARAVGFLAVTSPVGSLIGSTLGGFAADSFGYRYTFLVAVAAALAAIILTLFLKEKAVTGEKKTYSKDIVIEQLSDKTIWLLGVLSIVALMVPYATRDTFTPIFAKGLGAKAIEISILVNIHMIFNAIASTLSGTYFKNKFGLINTAVIGAVFQGLIAMIIPLAPNLYILYLFQAAAGFAMGLNFTVLMSLSIYNIPEEKQSTRMGLFQSLYSAGMFFGPMLMGIIIQYFSTFIGFIIIGIISIIAGLIIKFSLEKKFELKSV